MHSCDFLIGLPFLVKTFLQFLMMKANLVFIGSLYFILSIAFFPALKSHFPVQPRSSALARVITALTVIRPFTLHFLISSSSSCSFSLAGTKSRAAISFIAFFTFWVMKSSVRRIQDISDDRLWAELHFQRAHSSLTLSQLLCLPWMWRFKYFKEKVGSRFPSRLLVLFCSYDDTFLFSWFSTDCFLLPEFGRFSIKCCISVCTLRAQ